MEHERLWDDVNFQLNRLCNSAAAFLWSSTALPEMYQHWSSSQMKNKLGFHIDDTYFFCITYYIFVFLNVYSKRTTMFCGMFSQYSNIISRQEMCTQHFWHVCVHTATNNTGNLGYHNNNGTTGTSVTLIPKAAMVTIKLIVMLLTMVPR